ncbi:hypothetical protein MicroSTF_01985 [Microbacterium sp. STF-2]|uniref:hypothetical protein n=1 Tax=Microbacterium sp. STF-2 TaxID=3031132 RepID=UPI002AFF9304|nr:hypothetical protein [Microbacterium sp. STF-2]MEA1261787.1 hypothetical protein [Microbacterium sp. STF-2]
MGRFVVRRISTHTSEPYIALPLLGVSALSVAYGWYWTASRALCEDPAPQAPIAETQLAG